MIPTIETKTGFHCIFCDREWPGEEMPLWHTYVFSTTKPWWLYCDDEDQPPAWHAVEIHNHNGYIRAFGVVCPQCVTDKGLKAALEAAVIATCYKAFNADRNVN